MDDLIQFLPPLPEPCATVYVFGVKRPKDSEPWYLAFKDQGLAEAYKHRCTAVTAVLLYERDDPPSNSALPQQPTGD